jgi:hypothetical protein
VDARHKAGHDDLIIGYPSTGNAITS